MKEIEIRLFSQALGLDYNEELIPENVDMIYMELISYMYVIYNAQLQYFKKGTKVYYYDTEYGMVLSTIEKKIKIINKTKTSYLI